MDKVKLTSIVRKIFIAYATYVALSLALILPMFNIVAGNLYSQFTGRHLDYKLVGFNPFSLSLFAYGLRDANPDGSTLWAMDRLVINPSVLQSTLRGAIGIDEIRLLGLSILPEKIGVDTFNFSDVLRHIENNASTPTQPDTQTNTSFTLPRVWIGEFELRARLLQYTESHREKHFNAGLRDFHFKLQDFSTLSEQGDGYRLRAESAQGGALEWQGDISASGSKTWGSFSLSNVKLLPIWQFMEPQLNFALKGGAFSIQGQYQLDWKKSFNWQISEVQAALENFDIQQTQKSTLEGKQPSAIRWQKFEARIANVSSLEKTAVIESLSLDGFSLSSWHQNAQFGLVDMFTLVSENKTDEKNLVSKQSETTNSPAFEANDKEGKNSWHVSIADTSLNSASVHWLVPELDNRNVKIDPINLHIKDLSNGDNPALINANITIDKVARIVVGGDFVPQSKNAAIKLNLTNLPLSWANPIITQQLNAHLSSGDLNTDIDILVENAAPTRVNAALNINHFDVKDNQQVSIASIQNLTLSGLQINPALHSIQVKQIDIEKLNTRVAIAADGSTNFNTLAKNNSVNTATKAPETKPQGNAPYQWQIADINLNDAAIHFTDETPLSTFSTQIESFSGHIRNINSDTQQALNINLKGQVDGYAPVTLIGKAKPFLADPAMDLALNFKAIDLGLFNPYSTTFTGWNIEKGLLNVSLNYQLEDKRIVGQNRVVLDQLSFGERIESRRLIDIPLRLALALLTDENGIADLQVPVAGTTDDPSFSIGAIVWAAVRNSVMKLITAPFNLLASLVDTEEDLGQVLFDPQQAVLTESATTTLTDLKLALDLRPQLRLGVTGDVNVASESIAFKQQALNQQLLTLGLSQADIDSQSKAWRRAAISLLAHLESTVTDELSDTQLAERLVAEQPSPNAQLQQLAEKRAVAVKQYLLTNLAMDAERVFVQSSLLQCQKKQACTQARASFSIE